MAMGQLEELKKIIQEASRPVFFGGAGVSTKSGIPDFRSPKGLYQLKSEYGVPYETMLSIDYFLAHPDIFYDFYWKHFYYSNAKPNAAHIALSEYGKTHPNFLIITQNVDGLHQKAGNKGVLELHGNADHFYCMNCNKFYTGKDLDKHGVPHCSCGGIIRPDVVLYGEPLEERVVKNAIMALKFSDLLIVGGTSLNVYPAAYYLQYSNAKTKILINLEKTPYDQAIDYCFYEDIGGVLERILK